MTYRFFLDGEQALQAASFIDPTGNWLFSQKHTQSILSPGKEDDLTSGNLFDRVPNKPTQW